MKTETVKNELLGESYSKITHDSGLCIYVYPKAGYSSSYAVFGTKYGSIDTCFRRAGEQSYNRIPAGTAHFLEHKLFESEELDAFERFSKTGASANAYTSFDRTCYLFSCTDHFSENLGILVDFVRSPYFSEETVRKEQGIIGQEIDMYRDSPSWQSFFNLIRAMYRNHPVNIDIAGTKESIAQISADTLYSCYNTFYDLSNMVLAVAGNVTAEQTLEICDKYLSPSSVSGIERVFDNEPDCVVQKEITEKLSVNVPLFSFGYKETGSKEEKSERDEIIKRIIIDICTGTSSQLYKQLLEGGYINQSFAGEYFSGSGFAATLFSGESHKPREAAARAAEAIEKIKREGISSAEFERSRRKLYGQAVTFFNDVDGIANSFVSVHFKNEGLFSDFEELKTITADEVNAVLADTFDADRAALSVVEGVD